MDRNSSFSEREGIVQARNTFQYQSMDVRLRNKLWNYIYQEVKKHSSSSLYNDCESEFYKNFYQNFLNLPIYLYQPSFAFIVFNEWLQKATWNEHYDFIEFFIPTIVLIRTSVINDRKHIISKITLEINTILESELSAYRIVNGKISAITNSHEISSIERVLEESKSLISVHYHIESALTKLSDRQNPDYRSSCNESLNAVEAMCRIVGKNENITLEDALKAIEKQGHIGIHPALRSAFSKIYGYGGDTFRHALKSEENIIELEDATYMLVACSSFISYLIAKCSRAGINLE